MRYGMLLDLLALIYISAAANGVLVGAISLPLIISRSTLFAITMTHAVLGGAILGMYLNEVLGLSLPVPLTAFLVALMLSILVAELSERVFSEDVSIALAVALATTITVVFSYLLAQISPVSLRQAWAYVAGTSAVATLTDLQRTLTSLVIVVPLMHMISGEIKYIAFDRDGAAALGLNTRAYRYLFFALASLAASTLSMSIGVLAAHVLLAIPGAIAIKFFRRRLFTASYLSAAGLSLGGYALAQALNIPPSGGIGILSAMAVLGMVVAREA